MHLKRKLPQSVLCLLLVALFASQTNCKQRTFSDNAGVHSAQSASNDNDYLVNVQEMMNSGVFASHRELYMTLGSRDDAKAIAERLGVTSGGKRQQWIFLATIPLQTSVASFRDPVKRGIVWGGNLKSYQAFASSVLNFGNIPVCEPQSPMSSYPEGFATDALKHREIVCLRAIHKSLGYDGVLREALPQARMVDANALSDSEITAIQEISREGYLKPLKLFRDSSGQLVPLWTLPEAQRAAQTVAATGIEYPSGEQVASLLSKWNDDAASLDTKSDSDFTSTVAALTRSCISIHPFKDANGRTCRVWMARQFLLRGKPSPLMWSDQDILLKRDEFSRRVSLAVSEHAKLIIELKQ